MSQLPNCAASRMQGGHKTGGHPSADLLAGFSEQRLRPSEREAMLQHLAFCTECREIVYLAMPTEVEATPVAARGAVLPRLGLWRWAGMAASVVVIVGAMLMMRPVEPVLRSEAELASSQPQLAKSGPAGKSGAPGASTNGLAGKKQEVVASVAAIAEGKQAPATAIAQSRRSKRLAPKNNPAVADAGVLSRQARPFAGQYALGGTIRRAPPALADQQAAMDMNAFNLIPAPSPSPARERALSRPAQEITYQFEANGPAAQSAQPISIEGDTTTQSAAPADAVAAISPLEQSTSQAAQEEFSLGKAKEGRVGKLQMLEAVRNRIESGFRVADGRVQYIPLKERGNAWRDLQVSGAESLRVLAFRGKEIWVAGEKGSLYRSRDDGKSWERVSTGISGDASIMFLAFRDPENGELTTSSGEKWTTTDGGHSWKKRD